MNWMRPQKLLAIALLAGVTLLSTGPGFSIGASPAEARDDRREAQSKRHWQNRYVTAKTRVIEAQDQLKVHRTALRKARQRDRLKGEHRTKILGDLEDAREELETAKLELAELPEIARRAGIPPGWLREIDNRQASKN
jgi:hypothetical protein